LDWRMADPTRFSLSRFFYRGHTRTYSVAAKDCRRTAPIHLLQALGSSCGRCLTIGYWGWQLAFRLPCLTIGFRRFANPVKRLRCDLPEAPACGRAARQEQEFYVTEVEMSRAQIAPELVFGVANSQ